MRYSLSGVILCTRSGRSAARLARLVRDQEVGGSTPLAPTRSILHTIAALAACACVLATSACTPAPKYRVRSPEPRYAGGEADQHPDSIPALGIRLLAPVKGFSTSQITSPFGRRSAPGSRGSATHEGIDIKARSGEEVVAAAPGAVIFAGRKRGYGNVVIVDHGSDISTLYAHLSYACVRTGERVEAGQRIGRAGRRGTATGTHLHFELRRGRVAIDPVPHL